MQRLDPAEESAARVGLKSSGQTQGVSVTELCGFGVGVIPLFLCKTDWCLPLTGDLLAPPSGLPADPLR